MNSKYHYKVTQFILNPDHEKLGSFKTDFITNGADVSMEPFRSNVILNWQDGKVIDKNGSVIMDLTEKNK